MLLGKIKQLLIPSKILALIGLGILILLSLSNPLSAQTVTQAYNSDDQLQRGMIVVIDPKDSTKVGVATIDKIEQLHGIVVDSNDAPVTLSSEGKRTFVATLGRFEVLVNDENGSINVGDYVSVSSLSGAGAKADNTKKVIVGKALTPFDGKSGVVSTSSISGRQVNFGRVFVDVGVAKNPIARSEDANIPGFLRQAAETIVQKRPIDAARIYISLIILLVAGAISASILYAGVRSSITAVGRNPLSKKSIIKSLIQVVVASLIVFISGLFGVYLLLKL